MKIKGYENYEVRPNGEVVNVKTGKILKQYKTRNGYMQVALYEKHKQKRFYVHRLVAEAFIPNPYNLPQVNHIDEDKTNNFVFLNEDGSVDEGKSNLEWCTNEYNSNYGTRTERIINSNKKTVYQYTLDGQFLKEWKSLKEIEHILGYSSSNISSCCNNKLKHSYGFRWSFIKRIYRPPNRESVYRTI